MFGIHSTAQLKWIEDREPWIIIYGNRESDEQEPRESRNREMDAGWKREKENKWYCNGPFITLISNIVQHIPFVAIVKWHRISHMDALQCRRLWYASNQPSLNHNNMQYAICVRVIDLVKVLWIDAFLMGRVLFRKSDISY